MSAPAEEFYSEERWQNWLDRLRDEEVDFDDEESARLSQNLQDDVALAVGKIVTAYDDGHLDDEGAVEELTSLREIVLAEADLADENTAMLVESVQTSLECAVFAGLQYVTEGAAEDAGVEEYVRAAADAEAEEDLERALGLMTAAGTRVIDGDELDPGVAEDVEYGFVTEWVRGLDSLQVGLSDPEVIEDDE